MGNKERCEDCKQMRSNVDIRQCDYRLCDACNVSRFGQQPQRQNKSKDDSREETTPKTISTPVADTSSNNDKYDVNCYQNELLAYILYYFSSCSLDTIRRTVLSFYSPDEIATAKDLLWDTYTGVISVAKHRRISTSVRAAHEADISDILSVISEIDQKGELHLGKYYAVDLSRLPRNTPEDTNTLAVLDRLRAVELQLSEIKDITLNNTTKTEQNKTDIDRVKTQVSKHEVQIAKLECDTKQVKPSYSNALNKGLSSEENMFSNSINEFTESHPIAMPSNRDSSVAYSRSGFNNRGQFNPRGGQRGRGGTSRTSHFLNNIGLKERSSSVSSLPVSIAGTNATDEFQFPSYQKRRIRRRQKVVTGQATNSKLKGAPLPSRDVFIYRVDKNTTVDILSEYISENSIDFREIECVSHEDAKYKSFRLTVSIKDLDKIFNEALWPSGVMVRRFYKPNTNVVEQ